MNSTILALCVLASMPVGELRTTIAIQADVAFRESLPQLPDDFGNKKPRGSAWGDTVKEMPVVYFWAQEGCPPCSKADAELSAAEAKLELPFVVKKNPEGVKRPAWAASSPAFSWEVDGVVYTPVGPDRKPKLGWFGVKALVSAFESSQKKQKDSYTTEPTQYKKTKSSGVQQHNGHNCPSCGRAQYIKQNERGPVASTQTHQCNSCGTSWYHADQASSGRSRAFFGWTF